MKRLFVIVLLGVLIFPLKGQNLMNTAMGTNGPVGELLFDQDSNGVIEYCGIVEPDLSADVIFGLAKEFLHFAQKKYNAEVSDLFEGITKIACNVELSVGKKYIDVPLVGTWQKAASTVSFSVLIEVRNGRYRYTLSDFITDRWRIPGDGKDNGQSNVIHWQRVNSLKKEMVKSKDKDDETGAPNRAMRRTSRRENTPFSHPIIHLNARLGTV